MFCLLRLPDKLQRELLSTEENEPVKLSDLRNKVIIRVRNASIITELLFELQYSFDMPSVMYVM